MKRLSNPDRLLGLTVIVLSVATLAIWIPLDIESGIVEKMRRQVRIGDAMLPVLGLGFVILGGAMVAWQGREDAPTLSRDALAFLLELLVCLAVALAFMRWAGPLAVQLVGGEADYRTLRDTAPWKHLGFIIGGTALVAGLMAIAEGRVTVRSLIVGLLAALALIVVYDLPFDDLLLPPNGDV